MLALDLVDNHEMWEVLSRGVVTAIFLVKKSYNISLIGFCVTPMLSTVSHAHFILLRTHEVWVEASLYRRS